MSRLARALAHPLLPLVAFALAALLPASSLLDGTLQDDEALALMARDQGGELAPDRAPWDLFRFYSSAQEVRAHRDAGTVPWWVSDSLRLVFFRPLSSLWHYLDFAVLELPSWAMHLESLLLSGVCAALVALFLRRIERSRAAAGLAALAFAIDDAHGIPAGWICHRNALLAFAFGMGALILHDRWRRVRRARDAAGAALCFALGLASGEAAIGALAYLIAYAGVLERGPLRARAASLLPYLALTLVYAALLRGGDYGAVGSSFYVDPSHEPLRFAALLPIRLVALAVGLFGFPPSETALFLPPAWVLPAMGVGALFLFPYAWTLRREVQADRVARFHALGLLLALIPVCATWPNDRLLLFAGVGAFPLVVRLIRRAFRRGVVRARALTLGLRGLAVGWIVLHFALAPLALPLRARTMALVFGARQRIAVESLPADPAQRLIVLRAPDPLVVPFAVVHRIAHDEPTPARVSTLAVTEAPVELTRVAERRLRLRAVDGFMADPLSRLFRPDDAPLTLDTRVRLPGLTVSISELHQGRPRVLEVVLDDAPQAGAQVFATWTRGRFHMVDLPAVGDTRTLGD